MKEGLEIDHVKRHGEDMRNIREGMDTNNKKRMIEEVERTRAEILNNGSAGGTNDAVQDLSITNPMSNVQ